MVRYFQNLAYCHYRLLIPIATSFELQSVLFVYANGFYSLFISLQYLIMQCRENKQILHPSDNMQPLHTRYISLYYFRLKPVLLILAFAGLIQLF